MMKIHATALLAGACMVVGCSPEPPPRSVQEFVDNPILLEAAMVRCAQNRAETRYDAECVNARQAVSLVEAREERARREALEAQSARKREALRRTQEAAAEARRRSEEAERLRSEAEYLAQFGEELPPAQGEEEEDLEANVPGAVLPRPDDPADMTPAGGEATPGNAGGNAPVAETGSPQVESAAEPVEGKPGIDEWVD
ncbi:MAG: EexN family lipoprotein [Woeseiaceae bacterium]|jgi:hypothetical protein